MRIIKLIKARQLLRKATDWDGTWVPCCGWLYSQDGIRNERKEGREDIEIIHMTASKFWLILDNGLIAGIDTATELAEYL